MSERVVYKDDRENVLIGTEHDREIYVDGIWGLSVRGPQSIVKLNLYSNGFAEMEDGESPAGNCERRELVCRLVMGIGTFLSISRHLTATAEQIESRIGPHEMVDKEKSGPPTETEPPTREASISKKK